MSPNCITSRLRPLGHNKSGSVMLLSAFLIPVSLTCAALAVDLGNLYLQRRQLQGVADLAALAAASDLDRAERGATMTVTANGLIDGAQVVVTKGLYTPDPTVTVAQRFQPNVEPFNAARVEITRASPIYFAKSFFGRSTSIHVSAMSSAKVTALFSVGSRLASVRGGIANSFLSALTGSSVDLSVMDYQALIDGQVQLMPFFSALATELHLTAATYNQVLDSNVTIGTLLDAVITSTHGQDARLTAALRTLRSQLTGVQLNARPRSWINLGDMGRARVGSGQGALNGSLSALELVRGALMIANGKRQLDLNLGASVPNLASLSISLAIGEPLQYSTWASAGGPGSRVTNVQTRLQIVAEIQAGAGAISGARIRLPLQVSMAGATGALTAVTCSRGQRNVGEATISTNTQVAVAQFAEPERDLSDLSRQPRASATLVQTPFLSVVGGGSVTAGESTGTDLIFTDQDIKDAVMKRAYANSLAQSVVTSLLQKMTLSVNVAGLSVAPTKVIADSVASTLGTVAADLDSILFEVLGLAGLNLGEADVRVYGVQCGSAVLAG